jgi:site-specific DNA recombinase
VARRVETEFVGDRLAGARLAQAYAILAPERRRVTGNERRGDERRQRHDLAGAGADGPGGGDLRAGVLRAPAPRRDDPQPDAALRELAAGRGLVAPEDLVFEDEGFSGATLRRPALERLRDRAAEGCLEVLLCHAETVRPLEFPGFGGHGLTR